MKKISPYVTTQRGVLFCDDCVMVMGKIRSGVVDTVFADPPFNISKNYGNGYDDNISKEDYFKWSQIWINECIRVLKPGGAFFLYALPELNVKFANMMGEEMIFRHWIALTMKGSFPRGNKLYPAHYSMLYYTKGMPKTFNKLRLPIPTCRHCGGEIPNYGGHRNKMNPAGVNLSDFWEDTSPNRHKKFKVRPGVNELKLIIPERAIMISTNPRDVVLDPFGGGGTTYQAAESNERNWIGMELYDCPYIKKRLQENLLSSFDQEPSFDYKELFI
jgi:site-specific DNA-methyltransferase (adenine-specific)